MRSLKATIPVFVTLLTILTVSCSRKNYSNNNNASSREEVAMPKDPAYSPPPVIYVADDQAKTNKKGEMYYDNSYGYRYWRFCDGRYYLDVKYDTAANDTTIRPATRYRKEKISRRKKRDLYEKEED